MIAPQYPENQAHEVATRFGFLGLELRGELVEEADLTSCELRSRDFQRKPLGTIHLRDFFHRA